MTTVSVVRLDRDGNPTGPSRTFEALSAVTISPPLVPEPDVSVPFLCGYSFTMPVRLTPYGAQLLGVDKAGMRAFRKRVRVAQRQAHYARHAGHARSRSRKGRRR